MKLRAKGRVSENTPLRQLGEQALVPHSPAARSDARQVAFSEPNGYLQVPTRSVPKLLAVRQAPLAPEGVALAQKPSATRHRSEQPQSRLHVQLCPLAHLLLAREVLALSGSIQRTAFLPYRPCSRSFYASLNCSDHAPNKIRYPLQEEANKDSHPA